MNAQRPAKELKEKRIGDLFIEMGFVTERQLKEALEVAKEQNVKVGEALCSMGILDKDHIYWVLSNQLKMNYIELSSEMIDEKLIKGSSIDILEQLRCVPLFEEAGEIHLALADPTDREILEKVKTLNPGKSVQVHLALPDKIAETLAHFRRRMTPTENLGPLEKSEATLPVGSPGTTKDSKPAHSWDDVEALFFSMPREEVYWIYRTPQGCRLISQREENFKILSEPSEEIYLLIKERLADHRAHRPLHSGKMLFLSGKPSLREQVFKLWEMDAFGKDMIRIEPIPTFTEGEFFGRYPEATGHIEELRNLLDDHPRVLIGGKDGPFIKQCCYSFLGGNRSSAEFPPSFFFETETQIYLPGVAQAPAAELDTLFFDRMKKMGVPFIFYETEFSEAAMDRGVFSKISSGTRSTIIVYVPFPSYESMRRALLAREGWRQAGFEATFFSEYELKSI